MAAESVVEDLDRVVFGGRTLTESEANTKAAKVSSERGQVEVDRLPSSSSRPHRVNSF